MDINKKIENIEIQINELADQLRSISEKYDAHYTEIILLLRDMKGTSSVVGDEEDDFENAKEIVIELQKASTSLLQRSLGMGYARAARTMDMLEEKGVVGPADGAKPREVLLKSDEEPEEE